MLNRLRYSSSLAFLRFMLCAVISLTVFVGNSLCVSANTEWEYLATYAQYSFTRTFAVAQSGSGNTQTVTYKFDGPSLSHEAYFSYGDVLRIATWWDENSLQKNMTVTPNAGAENLIQSYSTNLYLCINGERYLINNAGVEIIIDHPSRQTIHWSWEVDVTVTYFMVGTNTGTVVYDLNVITPQLEFYRCDYEDIYGGDTTIIADEIQNQTTQQNQNAQAQLEATEKQNELQEEANETTKGIFDKITDFFNGFFENITNTASGLFIPEDGYFEDFFVRMNDFFAEKLGALYAPIDMFVTIMNGILNADSVAPGIPFPGVKWNDTYIIEPTTVSFDTFYEQFPDLQEKIYFATDVILVGSVIWLLQVKLKEVMMN